MRLLLQNFVVCLVLFIVPQQIVAQTQSAPSTGQNNPCAGISLGIGASLNGYQPFPPSSPWNTSVQNAPVDPNSAAIINFIGSSRFLHPDFGSGTWHGHKIGVPYIVVPGTQTMVDIHLGRYGDESDPGPMPFPPNAPVQGDPNATGDRHAIVLDQGNCWLYELYGAAKQSDNSWDAVSTAVWDLETVEQRPYPWTSTNAAGVPEFAGLVRYDEVAAGEIRHAIAVTLRYSKAAFTPPASHWAANSNDPLAAPMGMRMRLKAGFDISGFPAEDQVILTALKQYGMIMVDNGAPLFLSGTPDARWNNSNLHLLNRVTASDFEVLLISPLYTASNLPTGPKPVVRSFQATASKGPGTPVTLSWNVSYGEYYIVTPAVGAIRGTSVVVNPTATTTYTLIATNPYGRVTQGVTVSVP